MPGLRRHFDVGVSQAQLILSVFIAAFAIAQLFYGPLSDRFGRRPTLISGLFVFSAASLACALAGSIEQLIVARFFQALGCCAPTVIGRAVVRDVHGAEGTARMLGYISAGMSLLICAWPMIGGQLEQQFGWRAVFALHAVAGGSVLLAAWIFLAESNRQPDPAATNIAHSFAGYGVLLSDRRFIGYALCNAFTYGGIMAFLYSASFVLMGVLGLAAWQFGLMFSVAISGYILGTLVTARVVTHVGINRLMQIGTTMGAAAGIIMAMLALSGIYTVIAIIVPYFFFLVATGLNQPSAMAGAIGPFPRMAGTSSALLGFLQLAGGALIGSLVGRLHDGTPVPMAVGIALCSLAVLASYHLIVRRTQARRRV